MPTKQAEFAGLLKDPARYARGILKHDVWGTQARILRSVAENPRTAVKACHASGKTFCAAEAAMWWITRYPDGMVITTAPTWTQVKDLLWGEMHKAILGAEIDYPEPNQTEIRLGPGRYAMGLSTDQGVRFQGFHGTVLIIMDEAPGVRPDIWEAIEGIRAGGKVHVLALGNPTVSSGPFYDAFSTQRTGWETVTISAFDTPNLAGLTLEDLLALPEEELDDNPRPYLVTRRWVKEKYFEWGPGHPLWEARVMGRFPPQSEDALVSLSWLEASREKPPVHTTGTLKAGLDVAGPGEDETVLVIRDADSVVDMRSWKNADPRGDVVDALRPYKLRLETVNVDSVGIGYYMARHLRDAGFPVRDVNAGERSSRPERYANVKAEGYWALRMRVEAGEIRGLIDETAVSQLAGLRYEHNARGQIVIESKEQARKRGVKSPDRAEALMLAFYERPYAEIPDDLVASFDLFSEERPKKEKEEPEGLDWGSLVANDDGW